MTKNQGTSLSKNQQEIADIMSTSLAEYVASSEHATESVIVAIGNAYALLDSGVTWKNVRALIQSQVPESAAIYGPLTSRWSANVLAAIGHVDLRDMPDSGDYLASLKALNTAASKLPKGKLVAAYEDICEGEPASWEDLVARANKAARVHAKSAKTTEDTTEDTTSAVSDNEALAARAIDAMHAINGDIAPETKALLIELAKGLTVHAA